MNNNYPSKIGKPTILEILDREGILLRTVNRIADSLDEINRIRHEGNKLDMREIIAKLANCSYEERKFSRRYGDATIMSRNYFRYRIRMDPRIRGVEYAEYIDTLLHELAHVIDFILRGKSDHGRVWQYIAASVGATPEASKEASTELKKSMSKYRWNCSNDDCSFVYYFNRKKKGAPANYRCPKCRSKMADAIGCGGYNNRGAGLAGID
jgi:predicted SprT family Zn-dependent metalloprotease